MENSGLLKNKGLGKLNLFPRINAPVHKSHSRSEYILNMKFITVPNSVSNLMLNIKSRIIPHTSKNPPEQAEIHE